MDVKLIRYDAACRAIALAKRVDEVKRIRDVSIAMRAYAKQANNFDLEADAIEIRMRATRRMDQMRQEQKQTIGLNQGARGVGTKVRVDEKPTLAEAGIDKNLAHEGRKLGAMTEREFEKAVKVARDSATHIAKAVHDAMHAGDKAQRRAEHERILSETILALPQKRYGVIVADPEWRFEPYSEATGSDRAAANYYSTSTTATIAARDVASIAADDCVLFLWATAPMLADALSVMAAWGFSYKSNYVWNKDKIGTGYWNRNKHEHLLIGTKGNVPAPAPGKQWPSVINAKVGKHSAKPGTFLLMIEEYFPHLPKIELNRRGPPLPGWDSWGLEAQAAE